MVISSLLCVLLIAAFFRAPTRQERVKTTLYDLDFLSIFREQCDPFGLEDGGKTMTIEFPKYPYVNTILVF